MSPVAKALIDSAECLRGHGISPSVIRVTPAVYARLRAEFPPAQLPTTRQARNPIACGLVPMLDGIRIEIEG